jgi:hypothetical protein
LLGLEQVFNPVVTGEIPSIQNSKSPAEKLLTGLGSARAGIGSAASRFLLPVPV